MYHDLEVMVLPGLNFSLVLFGFLGSHLPAYPPTRYPPTRYPPTRTRQLPTRLPPTAYLVPVAYSYRGGPSRISRWIFRQPIFYYEIYTRYIIAGV